MYLVRVFPLVAKEAQAAGAAEMHGVRDVRPGPTKAELREQTAAAVASYAGPITRCAPKRRKERTA
jgi:hypothetical protein